MDETDKLHRSARREINEDLAREISENKDPGVKPVEAVIPFRDDVSLNKARLIYMVPLELLHFRKENGRIASDVASYEKFTGPIDEKSEQGQKQLRQFLENKDTQQTEDLMKSLEHENQKEPAVITADGFLINGNRRKMALEKLQETTFEPSRYSRMRVVILPGKGEDGGEPTIQDIELLELAYQFHHDGKSDYSNFDRALSIRHKEKVGISLEMQLRSDSRYARLEDKKFLAEVKKYRDEFLGPLDCIDAYLEHIGRPGDYSAISSAKGDPKGRWQAFLDYYKSVYSRLHDVKQRIKLEVEEYEVGGIEDAAFKILRQGSFGSNEFVPAKINDVMRKLPKVLTNPAAKKELLRLKSVPDGKDLSDKEWISENHKSLTGHVTEAFRLVQNKQEQDEPIDRLRRALSILESDDIDPQNVPIDQISDALKLINGLKDRVQELKDDFWDANKSTTEKMDQLKAGQR